MIAKLDFITFRSRALSSLSLLKGEQKNVMGHLNKDQIEAWVQREYDRHYGKQKNTFNPC